MRHFPLLPACVLLLFLAPLTRTGGAVRADELSLAGGPPAPRPTLAQALAALEPPKQDLFLTVGADKVLLPPGEPPPDPTDRPGTVGAAYGRLARDFGGVMALAPPTMMVLNTHLGVPDPYAGLPAEDALKLLLAGLSPPQWAALTGETGLGVSDLSDDPQRTLFFAALPSGAVTATARFNGMPPVGLSRQPIQLTATDLRAARLRLGRQTTVEIPVVGQPGMALYGSREPFEGKVYYEASSVGPRPPQDTAYGVALRPILLNSPKDADLDYDRAALKGIVRVEGLATVGDLVARVGAAAGLELYADPRYGTRRLLLVGRRTARAVDLLRAAAFCVTGTFRRVGPAYVLTDDLEGTAPRRQRMGRFLEAAALAHHVAVEAAGDSLVTARGGLDALPSLDDRGMNDAQEALPEQQSGGPWGQVFVPFAQLTPAQQEYVSGRVRQMNAGAEQSEQAGGGRAARLTLAGTFAVLAQPVLFLQSPAVPGPLLLDSLKADSLYQISLKRRKEIDRLRIDGPKNPMSALPPPAPPPSILAALLAPFPRRAVLVAPRTAREVDTVVAEMKVLGLNQLWLDVFSGGHSHLDKSGEDGPDILTEALARTKGTGITVIPALDLLRWGADAPAEARDLTALGETSAKQQASENHFWDMLQDVPAEDGAKAPPAPLWVFPAAPATEKTLLALVRRLAATSGVTTLVLHGTVPPGYNNPPPPNSTDSEAALGYVPALRLALLRRAHVDPVDLDLYSSTGSDALPEFSDWAAVADALKDWNSLRDGLSRDLLRRLLTAAQEETRHRFRFLVPQRGKAGGAEWYGLWENPQGPLPEVPAVTPKQAAGRPPWEINYAPSAHSQCRINLYALPAWAATNPYTVADLRRNLRSGWDGVVLDATVPAGGDPLADLAGKRQAGP